MNDNVPMIQSHSAQALVARETMEAQAAFLMAKRYPRDQGAALKRIESTCARPRLAEQALYSYGRGGSDVTGPSIRLAEAIGQQWGNLDMGFREVDRRVGESDVVAWCIDLETNLRKSIQFRVLHVRETKKETKPLTSERDIYELVANQASRRIRNCVLSVVPGDVVEAAIEACERTLKEAGSLEEKRKRVIEAFAQVDVSIEEIERRLGKKMTALSSIDYVQLRKIWKSLDDGMSEKTDWFEPVLEPEKIKRTQTEAAVSPPSTAPEAAKVKATADADRRVVLGELGAAVKRIMDLGGSANAILRTKIDVAHICQGSTTHSVAELTAMADRLNAWTPGAPNPG